MKKALAFLFACCTLVFAVDPELEEEITQLEESKSIIEEQLKKEDANAEALNIELSALEAQIEKLKNEPSRDDMRTGWFAGAGVGLLSGTFERKDYYGWNQTGTSVGWQPDVSQNEMLLNIDAQGGGITMFNRYFGIQYYADVEIGMPSTDSLLDGVLLATATANIDLIINFYNTRKFGIGVFGGVGGGTEIILGEQSRTYSYNSAGELEVTRNYEPSRYNWVGRANVGLRMTFGKYGVDFVAKIPFTDSIILDAENASRADAGTWTLKDKITFGVRFIAGQF